MDKEKIKEVMSYLGKQSVDARHKGKSKDWISRYYKKLRATKKNEKSSTKVQRKGEVV